MKNDPFSYLSRSGVFGNTSKSAERAQRPKVTAKAIAVKREPEYPPRTPEGKKEGWSTKGDVGATGGHTNDGWPGKKNTRSAVGKETEMAQPESPGDRQARAAGKKGVETQSAKVDPPNTAKRVGAKRANIEGNESAKYEKLEKRSLRSLKEGGSEKELRRGHNNITSTSAPTAPKTATGVMGAPPKMASRGVYESGGGMKTPKPTKRMGMPKFHRGAKRVGY